MPSLHPVVDALLRDRVRASATPPAGQGDVLRDPQLRVARRDRPPRQWPADRGRTSKTASSARSAWPTATWPVPADSGRSGRAGERRGPHGVCVGHTRWPTSPPGGAADAPPCATWRCSVRRSSTVDKARPTPHPRPRPRSTRWSRTRSRECPVCWPSWSVTTRRRGVTAGGLPATRSGTASRPTRRGRSPHAGATGTYLWCDPANDVIGVFFAPMATSGADGMPRWQADFFVNAVTAAVED